MNNIESKGHYDNLSTKDGVPYIYISSEFLPCYSLFGTKVVRTTTSKEIVFVLFFLFSI